MITYVNGDVFTADVDIIAHGCNCVGSFKAGIAGQIASKYTKAKIEYMNKYNSSGWKLGEIQRVEFQHQRFDIYNCATQYHYYPIGKQHADYVAIEMVMEQLYQICKRDNLSIAIPKIGSALAGGDWKIIEHIINKIFHDYPITVYVYTNS